MWGRQKPHSPAKAPLSASAFPSEDLHAEALGPQCQQGRGIICDDYEHASSAYSWQCITAEVSANGHGLDHYMHGCSDGYPFSDRRPRPGDDWKPSSDAVSKAQRLSLGFRL